MLTSPLLPPQTLGMGSLGRNSTFFQYSINTTQHHQRYLYRDTMRGSRNFLPGGGGGGGRGGGSRLLNLFYSLKRGSNGIITHFLGGGVQLFPGWGSNRKPYNYNLQYPPLDPHMDIVAFWHE